MNDRFVRTGVFLAPFHALPENPLLCLERDMELLIHLDRLNYHEAWIGEHHSGGFEIIACPELFIAAAAERTCDRLDCDPPIGCHGLAPFVGGILQEGSQPVNGAAWLSAGYVDACAARRGRDLC